MNEKELRDRLAQADANYNNAYQEKIVAEKALALFVCPYKHGDKLTYKNTETKVTQITVDSAGYWVLLEFPLDYTGGPPRIIDGTTPYAEWVSSSNLVKECSSD